MRDFGVKINYLYNSGFALQTKDHLLIFDYFKDSVDSGNKNASSGAIGETDLRYHKEVLVFSSHNHKDHFNPAILNWKNIRGDIKYIISSDIVLDKKDTGIYVLSPYEEINIKDVYIKAYGSTDAGVSFLIKADGVNIFHSGDLNWWHWWDESREDNEKAEKSFKEEIEKIKGEDVDIAFFPVDPRLKDDYYMGAEYFIKEINPGVLIPMHFGSNYDITKKFSDKEKGLPAKIIEITHRGQEILL